MSNLGAQLWSRLGRRRSSASSQPNSDTEKKVEQPEQPGDPTCQQEAEVDEKKNFDVFLETDSIETLVDKIIRCKDKGQDTEFNISRHSGADTLNSKIPLLPGTARLTVEGLSSARRLAKWAKTQGISQGNGFVLKIKVPPFMVFGKVEKMKDDGPLIAKSMMESNGISGAIKYYGQEGKKYISYVSANAAAMAHLLTLDSTKGFVRLKALLGTVDVHFKAEEAKAYVEETKKIWGEEDSVENCLLDQPT